MTTLEQKDRARKASWGLEEAVRRLEDCAYELRQQGKDAKAVDVETIRDDLIAEIPLVIAAFAT